jgi:hypothetical protein
MVDRDLKLESGEDRSPIENLTDETIWERTEFGLRAWRGESTGTTVALRDETGSIGNEDGAGVRILPRNVWKLIVGSNILWRGRLATWSVTRGEQKADKAREFSMYLEDNNIDLRGVVVHGWARPAETDVARIQGLIAEYLSGNPSPTRNINGSNLVNAGSNTVSLPAETYNQTTTDQVIADIALAANKTYYLLPPRTTSDTTTGVLVYDGNDAVIERCPFRITDRESEVRASPNHYFFPIWNVGPAAEFNGQELLSGVWLFYGQDSDSYYHASKPIIANRRAWYEEVVFDSDIVNAQEAERKAEAILSFRQNADRTVNVTIGPLGDEHIGSIRVGQTIAIKARAVVGAEDGYLDLKIGQLKITSPLPHTWFAHLQLDRPHRMGPYGKGSPVGPKAPTAGTPGTAPTVLDAYGNGVNGDDHLLLPSLVPSGAGGLVVGIMCEEDDAPSNVLWQPTGSGGIDEAMTSLGSITNPVTPTNAGKTALYIFWRANPTQANANGRVTFTGPGGGFGVGAFVTSSSTTPTVLFSYGSTSVASSNAGSAGTNDLVMQFAGWRLWSLGNASQTPNATAGQTEEWTIAHNAPSGQGDLCWFGGHATGPDTYTVDVVTATHWVAAAVIQAASGGTAGDSTEPVGHDGAGSVGDDNNTFSPIDHVHEHGFLSTDETHYHDASDIEYQPTGSISATDVQAAIDELSSAGGAGLPWYIVTNYGATGDGTTDDSTSIQSAIDAAEAAGGGVVYFPEGTYQIGTTLVVDNDDVTLRGDSAGASIIRAAAGLASSDVVQVTSDLVNVIDLQITSASQKTGGVGLSFSTSSYCTVNRVRLNNQYDSIKISSGVVIRITDVDLRETSRNGIWITGTGNDYFIGKVVADNPTANATGSGILIDCTANGATWVEHSDFIHFADGLKIAPASGQTEWHFITGCAFDNSTNDGIVLGGAGGSVYGVSFTNSWAATNGRYGLNIGSGVAGVNWNGGKVITNGEHGVNVGAGSRIVIDGALIVSNGQDATNTYDGIRVAAGIQHLVVSDNIGSGNLDTPTTQRYGISFAAGATDYVRVLGNDFADNLSGAINGLSGITGTDLVFPTSRYEVVMSGSAGSLAAVTNDAETDWIYGYVTQES